MVTTSMAEWDRFPDIIGDGVSEQEEIMTAICETKGATFDGTDCVGELDDSTVHVSDRRQLGLLKGIDELSNSIVFPNVFMHT